MLIQWECERIITRRSYRITRDTYDWARFKRYAYDCMVSITDSSSQNLLCENSNNRLSQITFRMICDYFNSWRIDKFGSAYSSLLDLMFCEQCFTFVISKWYMYWINWIYAFGLIADRRATNAAICTCMVYHWRASNLYKLRHLNGWRWYSMYQVFWQCKLFG